MFDALRQFANQRWTRFGVVAPLLVVTSFLFFDLTGATDEAAHLDKVVVGVAELDRGLETPFGSISLSSLAVSEMAERAPFQVVSSATEEELRADVLARDVAIGFVFPEDFSEKVLGREPTEVGVIRSEANDAFTNAFTQTLVMQWQSNFDQVANTIDKLGSGGGALPGQDVSLIQATEEVVAPIPNFRLSKLPMKILFPFWAAVIVLSVFVSMAAREVASQHRIDPWMVTLGQVAVAALATSLLAAVMVVDIALFAWEWSVRYVPLWAFMWLTGISGAFVILGVTRLAGIVAGLAVSLPLLLMDQIVGGGAAPGSFAPAVYRWLESLIPMRYFTEGFRNILFGGTTSGRMMIALGVIGMIGIFLLVAGTVRAALAVQREASVEPPGELIGGASG